MSNLSRTRALIPIMARNLLVPPQRNFWGRSHHGPWGNWGLVDISKQIVDMERSFARMEREIERSFGLPRIFRPQTVFSAVPGSRFPAIEGEVKLGDNGSSKYVLKMDLGKDFNPENVKLTLKDRMLTIDAKFEQKSEDGNSRIYQEVSRSFSLPEDVKIEEVKSLWTPEGELLIEAPLPQIEAVKPKEIPISVEAK